jgi:hypothetical protein
VFTEPLPSNDRGAHINTDWREGFMKYSGAMIYIPRFIKIVSGIQSLMGEGGFTDTQHGDVMSLLSYFQNKESRLKIKYRPYGINTPTRE